MTQASEQTIWKIDYGKYVFTEERYYIVPNRVKPEMRDVPPVPFPLLLPPMGSLAEKVNEKPGAVTLSSDRNSIYKGKSKEQSVFITYMFISMIYYKIMQLRIPLCK